MERADRGVELVLRRVELALGVFDASSSTLAVPLHPGEQILHGLDDGRSARSALIVTRRGQSPIGGQR